jgi:mycothiol synthase
MAVDPCVIKNYCPSDLDAYVRFHNDAVSICRSDDAFLLAALKGHSPEPVGFSPKDLFLAEERGSIVGSCRVVPELPIARAVLRLLVARGRFSEETAAGLIRSAFERARDLKAVRVHADLRESDKRARDLFARLGFRPVRRYADMTLELKPGSIPQLKHADVSFRPLQPGAEAEFTKLQNLVFGGSWGFCPNTTSEIVQLLNTLGNGHDSVVLTYHGDIPVGYCWTARKFGTDTQDAAPAGRIHMMGVAPEFRGRGLGKHVLNSGLKHLADKGIQSVELTTDCENQAACSLYEASGFKHTETTLWYEKMME